MAPHLVQPSPTLMGRTPVARESAALDVFATRRARGVLRAGRTAVSLDPATWTAAARGAAAAAGRRAGLAGAWTRDRPLPYSVSLPWTDADHRFVRRALAGADVVIADYIFQAEAFADRPRPVPTAIVMHDLFHARDTAGEAGSGREAVAGIDAATEAALLARADATVAIQRAEADWVRAHVPGVRVILAPIAVDPVPAPQPGGGDRLLFVGSGTAPNVVGLGWFLEEVWPRVRRERPDATLAVAGGVARAFPRAPEGVRFLGLVPSLAAAYAGAAAVISPLTFGSGLKIKLAEAMAAGKAVVATSVTLQGVEAECRGAVLVADTAEAFARAAAGLLADEAGRAALAGRALAAARAHFAPATCHRELIDWLREVG